MILNDEEVESRLGSSLNLVNRLNDLFPKNSMSLFIPSSSDGSQNSIDENSAVSDLPGNVVDDKKIRLGLVRSKALDVMHDSLSMLHVKLPEVRKARDLSRISRDMRYILAEEEGSFKQNQQVIIYKPIINDISKYDTLVVVE